MTTYRIDFEDPDNLRPVEVAGVDDLQDARLVAAVLEQVHQRWPGAPLQVKINRQVLRGGIFAGTASPRLVGRFTLAPQG